MLLSVCLHVQRGIISHWFILKHLHYVHATLTGMQKDDPFTLLLEGKKRGYGSVLLVRHLRIAADLIAELCCDAIPCQSLVLLIVGQYDLFGTAHYSLLFPPNGGNLCHSICTHSCGACSRLLTDHHSASRICAAFVIRLCLLACLAPISWPQLILCRSPPVIPKM